ncbi:cupredoxin domain-containing protein [Salinibacter ruber]|uniref:cupredoxin domain-containing protein n=1 Tax=Salinibacter ruber TaxID=146919 RepID=UPI00216A06AD|nr:hypothetical protein [Salinibacter ruber]MCS4142085.1 plastocyanin [Salinibacter ruber]
MGNGVQVSAEINETGDGIQSVEADVSAFDAGTITLNDENGDGTYEAAFTVGGTASEGDQTATVTVTEGDGSKATAETSALTVRTPPRVSYDLSAQSNDGAAPNGVSGTVTFWRAGPDSSLVTLNLDADATVGSVSHPAHIHNNSVEEGGGVEYYLSAVNGSAPNGTSARKIGVPIEELVRFDGHVNVHESPANLNNVVAQGNIGANANGNGGDGLDFVSDRRATTYSLNASTTNGSVLSGGVESTVRLEELTSSKTLVTYTLGISGSVNDANGNSVDVAQIGHIHKNTVSEGGGIVNGPFSGYLGSVAPTDPAARSSRIVEASFDELTSYDGYVNLHQSNANAQYVFAQGNIGANATGGGGGSSADVTVTVTNVGTSAWEVTDVSGASGVAQTGTNNPTLTLKVGTRYRFENNGGSAHPLGFQDGSSSYLLNQDGSGSLEGNSDVNYEEDSEGITFTYAQALADEVASYRCTVHSQMEGDVQTDGGGSGGGGSGGGGGGGGY